MLRVFQKCFLDGVLKIKKINNAGILLLELDIGTYEEVQLAARRHHRSSWG